MLPWQSVITECIDPVFISNLATHICVARVEINTGSILGFFPKNQPNKNFHEKSGSVTF